VNQQLLESLMGYGLKFLGVRSRWIRIAFFCSATAAAVISYLYIHNAPAVDYRDVRIADGKAACVLESTKYGRRGNYFVDGIQYYDRYTKLDGLSAGRCNNEANGLQVRISYLVEAKPPHRRLLVGIWRRDNGNYLETLTPEDRMRLWQRRFDFY
jgi:hypothetical protein